MAYNEKSADRLREKFSGKKVKEIKMMGGLVFMVNGKMCAGVTKDEMMFRIDPDIYESALKKPGCRPMEISGKRLSAGWMFVDETGTKAKKDLDYWTGLALEFNSKAKASKKKNKQN
jgi:TfoX/Sxy family transcriptional regulator of competence genes